MNITRFLEHHSISENPFRAEEARHDPVFTRLGLGPTTHPDFEKIMGDLHRPATSIIFGEKGSGKTAIRMQLEQRNAEHNLGNPGAKIWMICYDDLNPMLDRYCRSRGISGVLVNKQKEVWRALRSMQLYDHVDWIMHLGVSDLMDRLLGENGSHDGYDMRGEGAATLQRAPEHVKLDLLHLQALYDKEDIDGTRARRLRKLLKCSGAKGDRAWAVFAAMGWLLPVVVLAALLVLQNWEAVFGDAVNPPGLELSTLQSGVLFAGALAVWGIALLKVGPWEACRRRGVAKRMNREFRTRARSPRSIAKALAVSPGLLRDPNAFPREDGGDDYRYELMAKFKRILRELGYTGMIVVLDRVDEPTLVNGDPERMRALIWPLLNNKFLQQDMFGMKMLLPIELRYELYRESASFFQEARLDKQNLIERLSWSGSMLYDLCNARLNACRETGSDVMSLLDLFEEDVSRQDLVDTLDQMHQPRDAFKLIYQCLQEHCANVTEEDNQWRIPRPVLDNVRRAQADRAQMFQRGARPA